MDQVLDLWSAFSRPLAIAATTALFALGLRTVWAAGIPSFGAIICGAVGGYLGMNLMVAGHGLPSALLLGGLAGFASGLLLAVALLRVPASLQALTSLAVVALLPSLARALPSWTSGGWTGGTIGLALADPLPSGWAFGVLAASVLLAWAAERSWFGLAANAVRQDPVVAAGLGIPVRTIQSLAYAIAGVLGGMAGVLLAATTGAITPTMFSTSLAFTALAAVLLGGAYHWLGPLLGTALILTPSLVLRNGPSDLQDFALAIIVVLLLVFLPRGLLDPREGQRRASRARHRQRNVVVAMTPADDRRGRNRRDSARDAYRSRLEAAIKRRNGGPT